MYGVAVNLVIPHFYESIPGWFTFAPLYRDMVVKYPSGSRFVEVGVYAGRSLAYLGVEVANSGKYIEIYGVDNYGFIPISEVAHNLLPLINRTNINLITGDSSTSSSQFEDESLDFVFIDANHGYEPVRKDILAWLPKVKAGGVIAGHDIGEDNYRDHPGVLQAVTEVFGSNWEHFGFPNDVWVKLVQ